MQTINVMDESAPCHKCGTDLTVLGNFTYSGTTENTPGRKDERCKCSKCGETFILRYEFFDESHHISSFVFTGDVNDPSYNWQDQLTPEQKKELGDHLKSCQVCMDRLNEAALSDALLASILHDKKITKNITEI